MPNNRRPHRGQRRRANRLSRQLAHFPQIQTSRGHSYQVSAPSTARTGAPDSFTNNPADLPWYYVPPENSLAAQTTRAAQFAGHSAHNCSHCGIHHSPFFCPEAQPSRQQNTPRSRADSGNNSPDIGQEVQDLIHERYPQPRASTPPLLLVERTHGATCPCTKCQLPTTAITTRFRNLQLLRTLEDVDQEAERDFLSNAFDPIFDRAIDLGLLQYPTPHSPPRPHTPSPQSPNLSPELLANLELSPLPDVIPTHAGGYLQVDLEFNGNPLEELPDDLGPPPPLIDIPADTESD